MTQYFDPSEIVRGIQQLLVSDKKKIGFLFGAGTSLSKKAEESPAIPAIKEMTDRLIVGIKKHEKYIKTIDEIELEIFEDGKVFTVETLLSNIEEKIAIIGNGTLNQLNKKELGELDNLIKTEILEIISVHNDITDKLYSKMVQCDFANWIKSANRKFAVEIFTTNYDYLFEIGLEHFSVPYYDGFTGSYKPFFNPDSLEDLGYLPQQTKLWKIHGSLGLHQDENTGKIVKGASSQNDLLIYPSSLKYNDSRKQPYASFMDRLNLFLKQDDAVLFVCGYSFGDEHINERILSALETNTTAHVFVLNYDIQLTGDKTKTNTFVDGCDHAKLAQKCRKLSILSSRAAVIGSKFGIWRLKREPDDDTINLNWYFDEDAPIDLDVPLKSEKKGNEQWTGEGELTIIDFGKFTNFLLNMIPKMEWCE